MKKCCFILVFLLTSVYSYAGTDISCGDEKVELLLVTDYCPLPEQIAFRIENHSQWFCTKTALGSNMIMAAKAKQSKIRVVVNSPDDSCASVPHYSVANMIWEL